MSQMFLSQASNPAAVARASYARARDQLRILTSALPQVVDAEIALEWAQEFRRVVVRSFFFLLVLAANLPL
jgi:hypothetical protein